MNQPHDAEKRRGWVATTHPMVARGLTTFVFVELLSPSIILGLFLVCLNRALNVWADVWQLYTVC